MYDIYYIMVYFGIRSTSPIQNIYVYALFFYMYIWMRQTQEQAVLWSRTIT